MNIAIAILAGALVGQTWAMVILVRYNKQLYRELVQAKLPPFWTPPDEDAWAAWPEDSSDADARLDEVLTQTLSEHRETLRRLAEHDEDDNYTGPEGEWTTLPADDDGYVDEDAFRGDR